MWWNGPGWGHMYGGWWLMPLFGIVCMLIFLYFISRIFGSGGGFCGRHNDQGNQANTDELRREIRELRAEMKFMKENRSQQENAS